MQQTDAWLDSLQIMDEYQRKEIKAKVLESFKNGKGMRFFRKSGTSFPQSTSQGNAAPANYPQAPTQPQAV